MCSWNTSQSKVFIRGKSHPSKADLQSSLGSVPLLAGPQRSPLPLYPLGKQNLPTPAHPCREGGRGPACWCGWMLKQVWFTPARIPRLELLCRAASRSPWEAKCFGVIKGGPLYQGNQFRMALLGWGVKLQCRRPHDKENWKYPVFIVLSVFNILLLTPLMFFLSLHFFGIFMICSSILNGHMS